MLWHDQTKVGNYDAAIRIPERVYQLQEARQHKTIALVTTRRNRTPTAEERAGLALFPSNQRNADGCQPLTYKWFHRGFKGWIDDLDIGRWVPHRARHSLATSLLRAGASLTHIRRYLGQVSEKMAEHYVHLTQTDLEDVRQHVWVAGPGAARPGELLSGPAEPLSREQAQALAIDLSRRSTPAEGGFCTFQPVVDGGVCPWKLDCHNCGNFVISGADRATGQKLGQVRDAIAWLRRSKAPLTYPAVARRAAVSRTFLYENPDARTLMEAAGTAHTAQRKRDQAAQDSTAEAPWRERPRAPTTGSPTGASLSSRPSSPNRSIKPRRQELPRQCRNESAE